ncbi:MAG TPA: hypothetical protein PLL35_02255 [Candidatus Cloacimonas sp.]|nr:hypothetical protein [Candidatus Cloacimonas sp.]HQO17546.1 hypothetical protein [Candidatus Cloacimonas sp.]
MARKHAIILEELEIDKVEDFTEAQKKYYTSLGFKPYLNEYGKVKWLKPDQHSLRINAKLKRPFWTRILSHKKVQFPHKRKHRPILVKFVQRNWLFIIIIMIVLVAVVYIFRNPQLIF